jgi:hypothetical protein
VTHLEATVHGRKWTQWKRGSRSIALIVALIFGAPLCRAQPVFPLHTASPYIADSNGHRVRLNAVNWYGGESVDYVVGGLQSASLQSIVSQIRSIGFNAVRLPWSNELYEHIGAAAISSMFSVKPATVTIASSTQTAALRSRCLAFRPPTAPCSTNGAGTPVRIRSGSS